MNVAARIRQHSSKVLTSLVLSLVFGIGGQLDVAKRAESALVEPPAPKPVARLIPVAPALFASRHAAGDSRYSFLANCILDRRCELNTMPRELAFTLTGDGDPALIVGATVTPDSFCRAGGRPLLGRSFSNADNRLDASRVVLISESLWRRQFGADRKLIGRKLVLNHQAYRVIGIMPAAFHFPFKSDPVEVWLPRLQDPDLRQLLTDATEDPGFVASLREKQARRLTLAN